VKVLVIHGPNVNMIGKRDPAKYGTTTMEEINQELRRLAGELGVEVEFFQSNHEGFIIDFLQRESSRACDGALVNPGALFRYSYIFRQALLDLKKPAMEVHMSDIHASGGEKQVNLLDDVRVGQVTGLKEESYYEGLKRLVHLIKESR
jgi:3-dehydroquinate dehydratase II